MNFIWSSLLYLLLLIPLLVAAYIWILRWRRRFAVRYSSLSLVREALVEQSWLRRHLPFVLFLLALASLIIALARPTATVWIPSNRSTIILALDVSRSMCSTDIPPNRLEAAKQAALNFISDQQRGRLIGIVAFAGFAELVQPPTTDRALLESAILNMAPARRTAIGSAILRSLDAIAEIDPNIAVILLTATVVAHRPSTGIFAAMSGHAQSALLLRRLLPVTVFSCLLVGLLQVEAMRALTYLCALAYDTAERHGDAHHVELDPRDEPTPRAGEEDVDEEGAEDRAAREVEQDAQPVLGVVGDHGARS